MISLATVAASVVASALVAWAVASAVVSRARPTRNDGTGENADSRILCTACGITHGSRAAARDHAREAHDAPGDDAAVDDILAVVDDG